jgi:5'-3' exonuclease
MRMRLFSVDKPAKVLIDGDIIAYQAAYVAERDANSLGVTLSRLGNSLQSLVILSCEVERYEGFLTGKKNFRFQVDNPTSYKANRKDKPKPKFLSEIRWFLEEEHGFVVSQGCEADDLLAIAQKDDTTIISSSDKDLMMVPGWHHSNRGISYVTKQEGMTTFYRQLVTGDATDNIKGSKKGQGPKFAEKIIKGDMDEESMYAATLKAFDGEAGRLVRTAHLIWMQRQPNELWTPPGLRIDGGHRVMRVDAVKGAQYPSDSDFKEWFSGESHQ